MEALNDKLWRSILHPTTPCSAVLHMLSLASAGYGAYVALYSAVMLGKVQRGAIHATLWTASMVAKDVYLYRPPNTHLWLPVIPGHYLSLERLAVRIARLLQTVPHPGMLAEGQTPARQHAAAPASGRRHALLCSLVCWPPHSLKMASLLKTLSPAAPILRGLLCGWCCGRLPGTADRHALRWLGASRCSRTVHCGAVRR